jgi:isopenicillin N synthase-like dioxygenase
MKRFLLSVASVLLTSTAFARQCSNDGFGSFCETKEAVVRLLSYPAYTGSDEKVLNRAGDMAALAIISSVSTEDLNSPEKGKTDTVDIESSFCRSSAHRSEHRP